MGAAGAMSGFAFLGVFVDVGSKGGWGKEIFCHRNGRENLLLRRSYCLKNYDARRDEIIYKPG